MNPEEIIRKSYESQEIPDSSVDLAWAKFQKPLPPQNQKGRRRILLFTILGLCISIFILGYFSINNNLSNTVNSTSETNTGNRKQASEVAANHREMAMPETKNLNKNQEISEYNSEQINKINNKETDQSKYNAGQKYKAQNLPKANPEINPNEEAEMLEPTEVIAYEEIQTQDHTVQQEDNIESNNANFWNTDIISRPISPKMTAYSWGDPKLITSKTKHTTGNAPGLELIFRLGIMHSMILGSQNTEKIMWPNTQLGMMYYHPLNRHMFGGLGLTAGFSGRNSEISVWNNKAVKRDSFGRELTTVDSSRFILKSFSYFNIPLRWGFKADRFRFMLGTDLRFRYNNLLRNNIQYQLDDSMPVPRFTLISNDTKNLRNFTAVPDVILFMGMSYTRGHHSFGISYNPELFMQYKSPTVMGLNRIPGKPQMRQEWTFNYAFRLY